ncbi:transglycosylase domain-containing protein [Gellertiella hungarica]|uniref:Penicillin-binding protein 1A n=1 Tax=Gellertiella hungarica TaxID=1572859 RepID=A0A7W6NLQ5_9HYPH|nr:transglycosylase domain-containing protein [Gellertiella hungarica]MBB4065829.1 penicillin-binding protein 1A [Gellertiella hungarica]
MAGKSRSRERIEPSFGEDEVHPEDDFRLDEEDRVVKSRGKPSGKPAGKSSGRSARGAGKAPAPERRKQRRGGFGLFRLIRRMVYWTIVLGIWGSIGIAGLVIYYGARMPSAETWKIPERPPNVKITGVDGSVIANRGATGGEELSLQEMSPYIPMALVAIEDRRFYSHYGVDPLGLARAMITNVAAGHMVQGGSTVTQQLAKNMFLSPERTLERKVQEVLLALWLEHTYSKDQILEMYLNRVFFGSNAYGVEAASRRYFNKSARDVTLGEAALLAGLLKAPSRLSPARDPQAAEARAQVVLQAMREEGMITEAEIKTAMSAPPTRAKSYWSGAEYYAADMVMDELPGLIGEVKQDIVVETTLDMTLEKKAEQVIAETLSKNASKYRVSQAALISIDGTGAIRAVVGGRDYADSQFNRATRAKRQPGSAFKPFVYAAALEMGETPASIFNDARIRIGNWTPENYDQKYNGPVTLAEALARSLNTVSAQLVMQAGPDKVIQLARRLGIASPLQSNASIALGTSEVTLAELTGAYASFQNGGYKATPHLIRRVTKPDGTVLYENTYDTPPRVLDEKTVVDMNYMMGQVIAIGTGKKAALPGWQVAGKTGTTQSYRDALFLGFTSNLVTGVWFGNDDGKFMKKVTGGGLPAQAWKEFMLAAHEGLSPAPVFGNGLPSDQVLPGVGQGPLTVSDVITGDPEAYPEAPPGEMPDSPDLAPDPNLPPLEASRPVPHRSSLLDILMGE